MHNIFANPVLGFQAGPRGSGGEIAIQQYATKMNESEDCTGIPWADSKHYMFWRLCQQCLACITAEAANQRETWQWSVYHSSRVQCPGERPTPSSYAVVAERLPY